MSAYFDTSALIRAWRLSIVPEGITRAHSIAEFYCVLTGPGLATMVDGRTVKAPVPPKDAAAAIRETFAKMRYRDVKASEAIDALAGSVRANIQGRSIHDWMHCQAAELAKCDTLVTLNLKDFTRMVTKRPKLVSPSDFFAKV